MNQPKDWKSLERHHLSAEYVDLCGPAWVEFVAGMRERRFSPAHPIVLHDGKVLDGWQRQRACVMTFVTPVYIEYDGDDPEGFVKQENDNRRHETPLQRDQRIEARDKQIVASRAEGKSLRTIAEEEGVSKNTVARAIESTVPCGTVEVPDGKVTGKDGRKRKARTGPKKPKAPRKCDRCTRKGCNVPDCEQCLKLNKPKPKRASPGPHVGNVGQPFDQQIEKCHADLEECYDEMLLILDRRAQAMGKAKGYDECIKAAFDGRKSYKESQKQYKVWVSA